LLNYLVKEMLNEKFKNTQAIINYLDCKSVTDAGAKEVQARYTFQYEFEGGKWLIEHHHSSAMLEKIAS
jgi:hypothetical protein